MNENGEVGVRGECIGDDGLSSLSATGITRLATVLEADFNIVRSGKDVIKICSSQQIKYLWIFESTELVSIEPEVPVL